MVSEDYIPPWQLDDAGREELDKQARSLTAAVRLGKLLPPPGTIINLWHKKEGATKARRIFGVIGGYTRSRDGRMWFSVGALFRGDRLSDGLDVKLLFTNKIKIIAPPSYPAIPVELWPTYISGEGDWPKWYPVGQ